MPIPADKLRSLQARTRAALDQEWATGLDWFKDSDKAKIAFLHAKLIRDDSEATLANLDPFEADIVCRLADLALGELYDRANKPPEESE